MHITGKAFFVHGNHAHKPSTTIPGETKLLILNLYQAKYFEANLTHCQELIADLENIHASVSMISSILRNEHILSPKAHRSTKKQMKKELKALKSKAKTKKQRAAIQSSILELEEAHLRHPRAAFFGEMIQMDASEYVWFGDAKTHLHIAVDDSTGSLAVAWFDMWETLNGYCTRFSLITASHTSSLQITEPYLSTNAKQNPMWKKIPLRYSDTPANSLASTFALPASPNQKGGLKE